MPCRDRYNYENQNVRYSYENRVSGCNAHNNYGNNKVYDPSNYMYQRKNDYASRPSAQQPPYGKNLYNQYSANSHNNANYANNNKDCYEQYCYNQ